MVLYFSLEEAVSILFPLFLFLIGMVVYSVFIFKFYRFVATRDIFELNLQQYQTRAKWAWLKETLSILLYILEYLILFPIFVSTWFAIFAGLLIILSNQSVEVILLIAMSIVATIRVTAYYSEDLSKDVAKMLPFALLGIFLIDISFFSLESIVAAITTLPTLLDTIVYYLIFAIFIEFLLRILTFIFRLDNVEGEVVLEE
tara:strand:+ start:1346 stop:1948 length:603 start_codon:yes stop_codon:yes gene_type:complete